MKNNLLLILLMLIVYSCKKSKDIILQDTTPDFSMDSLKALPGNLPAVVYPDLTFINEQTGFAVSQGLIVKTIDGGKNWTQLTVPLNLSLKKIQFTNSQTGYIIGGSANAGYLLKTSNAGQSWDTISLNIPDYPNGMYFINNSTGFITGRELFIKTTDGGLTWTNIKPNPSRTYFDINFKNANEGIATSSNGMYFKTSNAGVSWDSVQTNTANNLSDIYFTGTQSLVAITSDSLIDIQSNYAVKKPSAARKLLFMSSQKCIGIGEHYDQGFWPYGDVFITNNGWSSFQQKTFTTTDAIAFHSIARMTANKLMIIGLGFSGAKVLILTR